MLTLLGLPLIVAMYSLLTYAGVKLKLRTVAASTLLAWLAYGVYEALMQARVLCSGECNIRSDLLLIYPALLVLSAFTLIRTVVRWLKPPNAGG